VPIHINPLWSNIITLASAAGGKGILDSLISAFVGNVVKNQKRKTYIKNRYTRFIMDYLIGTKLLNREVNTKTFEIKIDEFSFY
jgi:hypothetical protein